MSLRMLATDDASKYLRDAGLRSTQARRCILLVMHDAGPMKEEEIAEKIGSDRPDTATLYRNLDALVNVGLVMKHHMGERATYFSLHLPDENSCAHAHFLCESCGHCECLENTVVEKESIEAGSRLVRGVELVVNGICSKCLEKSRTG